jgi:Carboxypeptidase regulatory-like domain
MKLLSTFFALGLLTSVACHHGPVIDTAPKPADVGGTIAGIVSTDTNAPVVGRKVTAINADTSTRYDANTGPNGGYTIKVPEGRYRLEVELQAGETVAKQPPDTRINKSDLDPKRDFVISLGRPKD